MDRFDYAYYRNTYSGMLDEVLFSRFAPTACDVVSMLVGRDCDYTEDAVVLRAMCMECDFLERQAAHAGVKSESLGDASVSYAGTDAGVTHTCSCPVSGEVIAALTRAGLLTRWT